jgi:hypothetical protein
VAKLFLKGEIMAANFAGSSTMFKKPKKNFGVIFM